MQIFLWSQFWPSSKNRFQITCLVHARTRDGLSSLVITHLKHMWEKVSFLEGAQCWELLLKEVPVLRRRQWHPTPVLLPGKSHGQRSLVGCSPWGRWGLDATERLRFHFSLSCIGEGNGNPLQCSCLENPRDRGAWWAAVYGSHRVGHDWSDLAAGAVFFHHSFPPGKGDSLLKKHWKMLPYVSMKFKVTAWLVPNSPRRRAGWKGCGESLPHPTGGWTSLVLPVVARGNNGKDRKWHHPGRDPRRTRCPQLSPETIV